MLQKCFFGNVLLVFSNKDGAMLSKLVSYEQNTKQKQQQQQQQNNLATFARYGMDTGLNFYSLI